MDSLFNLVKTKVKKDVTSNLEPEFLDNVIVKYFKTNGDTKKKLIRIIEEKGIEKIEKNKYFKKSVKEIREEIRVLYESFLEKDFNKKNILDEMKILNSHKSTKERLEFYPQVYDKIFSWYLPKKIADLACGLNPVSINYFNKNKFEVFAADLNEDDMNFLNEYFIENKIEGFAKAYDITKLGFLYDPMFTSSDLVFLFKALDSFETIKSNISKDIIKKIPQKKIVVSFPTKSLGQKKEISDTKRNWLRNFLTNKEYLYEEFEIYNELFFLITKN